MEVYVGGINGYGNYLLGKGGLESFNVVLRNNFSSFVVEYGFGFVVFTRRGFFGGNIGVRVVGFGFNTGFGSVLVSEKSVSSSTS